MSVLFGSQKSGKSNRKNGRRHHDRRPLHLEWLEDREMLAGGGIPLPPPPVFVGPVSVAVANQSVPKLDILPGGINKVLAQENITVKGGVARLAEMDFACVSGRLWDISYVQLTADMDGKASNGCETIIASAYGWNASDGILRMPVSDSFWVGMTPRKVQLVASFQTSLSTGQIGVQLAAASFCDLNGAAVPGTSVKLTGVKPVVHTLERTAIYFSPHWQPETATVYAGQKGVQLLTFETWYNGDKPAVLQNLDFVDDTGTLKNYTTYSLWVMKWQQGNYVTTCLKSGVKPLNGKVSFNFGSKGYVLDSGFRLQVRGDAASVLPKNTSLALTFGSGIKAKDASGKLLRGVALNGGEGQIRVYNSQPPLFNFKPAPAPGLHISEIGSSYGWTTSTSAQGLMFEAFNVYAKDSSAYITQVVINAAQGSLGSCANYVLLADSNGDGYIDSRDNILATGNIVGDSVVFDTNIYVSAGTTSRLEVHANVLATSTGMSLQTTLKSVATTSVVDYIHASQPLWSFLDYGNGGGGGMG